MSYALSPVPYGPRLARRVEQGGVVIWKIFSGYHVLEIDGRMAEITCRGIYYFAAHWMDTKQKIAEARSLPALRKELLRLFPSIAAGRVEGSSGISRENG